MFKWDASIENLIAAHQLPFISAETDGKEMTDKLAEVGAETQ